MLRREIRLLVFLSIILLIVILLYQMRLKSPSGYRASTAAGLVASPDESLQERNLQDYGRQKRTKNHRGPQIDYHFEPLPQTVVDSVRRFMFFVGYARSGHSIIASMLDAHPHVVIAHEYSLFSKWDASPSLYSNKTWLFNSLYNNSKFSVYNGLRTEHSTKKGYTLYIPGWWQGRYDGRISVIGDKSGGMTAQVFRLKHKKFVSLYQHLQTTVQMPISVIHVVRNPYDNIATMLVCNNHLKGRVNETHKYVHHEGLHSQIINYFNQVQSVLDMIEAANLNVIEIHNSDFIANPKATMRQLCVLLRLDCTEEYLHMCAEKTFTSESKSRNTVEWTPDLVDLVAQKIQRFQHLKRYHFYS